MRKIAKVDFVGMIGGHNHNVYNFYTNDCTLEYGDKVVVHSNNGLAIGNFKGYEESDTVVPEKWIIQKIDLSHHNKREEDKKRLVELKNKMHAKRKKAEEIQIYEILAKEDEEMAEMLREFKELNRSM